MLQRVFIAFGLIIFCATVHAAKPELLKAIAVIDSSSKTFTAEQDAAHEALHLAAELSKEHEYGGVLIQCGAEYRYTTPVTSNSPTDVWYDVRYPRECRVAAIYHAHPAQYAHNKVTLAVDNQVRAHSKNDVATAKRLGVPSYIIVVATKEILVWRP